MFEDLVNGTATRFNLPTASVSALARGVLSLITDERSGGAEGFVNLFRGAGLGDVITSWFGGMEGKAITSPQLESAVGKDMLDKLASSSWLTRETATSALTLLLPGLIGRLTPQGLLPSNRALQSQVSGFIGSAAAPPIEPEPRRSWTRYLPWAAIALLAVGGVLWARGPAGTIDPQITLSNRDGKVTYSGVVRDRPTRRGIVNSLHAMFGEANVEGALRVDRNVKRAPALANLGDVLPALKTPGVAFSVNGDAITVGGWLSAAERQALADKVRGLFGPRATIGSFGDPAVQAVRVANDKALSALSAMDTSSVSADGLVQTMNLAVINFSSGSAEIPAENMVIIQKCAEAIRQAPPRATLEIGGHTDNTGDPASNLALSQARADAVKRALVAAGVAAVMLTTRGYGDTSPRAPNDTEYGRFQNRRIEYVVVTK